MTGAMFISGYRGFGKSFLASQADLPDNIAFFDFESKGAGIDSQLNFGMYKALTQETEGEPMRLHAETFSTIAGIEPNRFTVAVFDNISPMEIAFNAYAATNAENLARLYGLNPKNVKANRFGGTRAIVNSMISDMCAGLHSKGIRLIIATSHIKPRWSTGGPIPNKFNVKGADRWQELSILTLLLIPGNKPPVPSALVQKEQLGIISIPDNPTPEQILAMQRGELGHSISRRLPPKISECTFQKIRWYLNNPADFDNLEAEEMPSFEESDPFAATLNKEQFNLVKDMTSLAEREEREAEEALQAMEQAQIQNLTAELAEKCSDLQPPFTPVSIMEHLGEKGEKITPPQAVAVMQKLQEK
jgi:hypothetical protein